jgi:hypothetical protein
MIDALAAILAYLGSDADLNLLTSGRIAAKHKFAMGDRADTTLVGWPTPSQALQLSYAAGERPDLDAGMRKVRLEARCYGESQVEASQVSNRILAICQAFEQRDVVSTGGGTALIYWLLPDDSPQFDRDPDIGIDMVRLFLRTSVASEAVT